MTRRARRAVLGRARTPRPSGCRRSRRPPATGADSWRRGRRCPRRFSSSAVQSSPSTAPRSLYRREGRGAQPLDRCVGWARPADVGLCVAGRSSHNRRRHHEDDREGNEPRDLVLAKCGGQWGFDLPWRATSRCSWSSSPTGLEPVTSDSAPSRIGSPCGAAVGSQRLIAAASGSIICRGLRALRRHDWSRAVPWTCSDSYSAGCARAGPLCVRVV